MGLDKEKKIRTDEIPKLIEENGKFFLQKSDYEYRPVKEKRKWFGDASESGLGYWNRLKDEFKVLEYVKSFQKDFLTYDKDKFKVMGKNDRFILGIRETGSNLFWVEENMRYIGEAKAFDQIEANTSAQALQSMRTVFESFVLGLNTKFYYGQSGTIVGITQKEATSLFESWYKEAIKCKPINNARLWNETQRLFQYVLKQPFYYVYAEDYDWYYIIVEKAMNEFLKSKYNLTLKDELNIDQQREIYELVKYGKVLDTIQMKSILPELFNYARSKYHLVDGKKEECESYCPTCGNCAKLIDSSMDDIDNYQCEDCNSCYQIVPLDCNDLDTETDEEEDGRKAGSKKFKTLIIDTGKNSYLMLSDHLAQGFYVVEAFPSEDRSDVNAFEINDYGHIDADNILSASSGDQLFNWLKEGKIYRSTLTWCNEKNKIIEIIDQEVGKNTRMPTESELIAYLFPLNKNQITIIRPNKDFIAETGKFFFM